jgi:hypothetical protein
MKKLNLVSVVLLVVFIFSACGNKDKENAMKYLSKYNDFVKSAEFKNMLTSVGDAAIISGASGEKKFDDKKFTESYTKSLNAKDEEFSKNAGFKDSKEAAAVVTKLKDEKEIKDLTDQIEKNVKATTDAVIKDIEKKVEAMSKEIEKKVEESNNEDGEE